MAILDALRMHERARAPADLAVRALRLLLYVSPNLHDANEEVPLREEHPVRACTTLIPGYTSGGTIFPRLEAFYRTGCPRIR